MGLMQQMKPAPMIDAEVCTQGCNYILSLGDDISESHLKLYAAFKKIRNVITVVAQKKRLILNLPLDVSTISFE